MITPRLTALIVAMSVLGTGGPLAAMAQEQSIGNTAGLQGLAQDLVQAANTGNEQTQTQVNSAVVEQKQETSLSTGDSEECDDCGSIDIERASVGTQESEIEQSNEAEQEAESGDIEQDAEQEQEAEQEVEGAELEDFIAVLFRDLNL